MPLMTVTREKPLPWADYCKAHPHRLTRALLRTEWVAEWIAFLLNRWTWVEVLEYLGRFSVLVAVILYFAESGEREQSRHFQAWQVINTAQGKGGSGGRIDALGQLNDDRVPLIGVDVSDAYLQGVRLANADCTRGRFSSADLRSANLAGANLDSADFHSANLRNANLQNAHFTDASLVDADLTDANLAYADLAGVNLDHADLQHANLDHLIWQKLSSISQANLTNVQNAPPGFLDWALKHGATQKSPTTEAR